MFGPGIGDDLPVVLAVHERAIRNHGSEQVVRLEKERVAAVARKADLLRRVVRVPRELVDIRAEVQQLQAEAGRLLLLFSSFELLLGGCFVVAQVPGGGLATRARKVLRFDLCAPSPQQLFVLDARPLVIKAYPVALQLLLLRLIRIELLLLLLEGLLAQHRLECAQNLLLVLLAKHVGELGHFFALFGAADEFFAHDGEPYAVDFQVSLDYPLEGVLVVEQQLLVAETGAT